MTKLTAVFLGVAIVSGDAAAAPGLRALSLDERHAACAALAAVDSRYATSPDETEALEAYWRLTPTDAMLEQQLVRMAHEIEPPERLQALYDALGNDPFLVKECLARPALVDRMSRDLFAFDTGLQGDPRARAEALRRRLATGELLPAAEYPGREVFTGPPSAGEAAGHVSDVLEDRESFFVFATLAVSARAAVVARYTVPKLAFDAWWAAAGSSEASVPTATVALAGGALPAAAEESCEPEPVQEGADLFALTYGAPIPVTAGDALTYTMIVTNGGPDTASETELLFLPPASVTFESIVIPGAGSWRCVTPAVGQRGKITCSNKCFATGVQAVFTITVRVDPCAGTAPLMTSTFATSATRDPFPPNNFAPTSIGVIDPGTCDDGSACTVDDHCVPVPGFAEGFDDVPTPRIPAGWTAALLAGPDFGQAWRTAVTAWDTRPNAAFSPDVTYISDSVLDSPEIPITQPNAQLRFRNYYNLEDRNDGGVLEMRIGSGPFEDILDAGGVFVEGGYDAAIRTTFGSPIPGRMAWTGSSGQFRDTIVDLPSLAAGRTITLRWRLATDQSIGSTGQWIDTITINDHFACAAGSSLTCDDGDACTSDSCEPVSGCRHQPLSCDDGIPCTSDACNPATGCSHAALSCDDGNPCTDDTCSGLECLHTNNARACDDGNACTSGDVCSGGACAGANGVVCLDADACTADACDPLLRCVATTANFDATGFSTERVDGRDLAVLAGAWGSCPGSPRYDPAANLERADACIDLSDFHLFMNTFGHTCP